MLNYAATALTLAVAAVSALPAGAPAIPSTTSCDVPTSTSATHLTGVTHSVVAGLGGLRFDPDNVVAQVGDVIEWHFLPKNHSVAQSSFDKPCQPLTDTNSTYQEVGFFSGFNFATQEGQAEDVFSVVVEDASRPIWYYCSQTNGDHCQAGMVGVVNQNFNDQAHSLAKHKELAAKTGVSVQPKSVMGGTIKANPNPNGGF